MRVSGLGFRGFGFRATPSNKPVQVDEAARSGENGKLTVTLGLQGEIYSGRRFWSSVGDAGGSKEMRNFLTRKVSHCLTLTQYRHSLSYASIFAHKLS